jgi:hypothetical protein
MKRVFGLLLAGSLLLASCSKKTHPTTSNTAPAKTQQDHAPVTNQPIADTPVAAVPTETAPATSAAMAPMIVIDEKGNIITTRDKLPADIAPKVNYAKINRGYTPAQRQNLIYRFKIVPPRVLYVPEQYAQKNAKGEYVIYKKKFWYWKKEDGLFHLDETYYQ